MSDMNWFLIPIVAIAVVILSYGLVYQPKQGDIYTVNRNGHCSYYKNGTWTFGDCK